MDILENTEISDETDPFYVLEMLRQDKDKEVSSTVIAELLFKFCDSKLATVEEKNLAKLANITVEKLAFDSPLTEVLRAFDCDNFSADKLKNIQFDYNRFFHFCRILCATDKQGFDIIGLTFFSKPWKSNAYFQLEFIKYCIRSNNVAIILSSCHNPSFQLSKLVPQVELLKCQPDYDNDIQLVPWKFQSLYQILSDLGENQMLYPIVEEIFFFPLNKCPDLLVLGLLECYGSANTPNQPQPTLRETVLCKAILKFLYPTSAHPNSTQIFQRIWPNDFNHTHVSSLTWSQKLLLTSMIELYSSSSPDEKQQKLSRILDLSQDLKALNLLLSSNSHQFVIDLACLASRREYLKLDKWLNDKIHTNGQSFIEACLSFLKRRCPAFGPNESNTMTFPNETFNTILACLRQFSSDNPKTLIDFELRNMCSKYSLWLQQAPFATTTPFLPNPTKPNQFDGNLLGGMQSFTDNQLLNQIRATTSNSQSDVIKNTSNVLLPDIGKDYSKDIEEEADSYFKKIYNQDLPDSMSTDQVLEVLKKFQESPNKREKEVFACMIRNLFKEYPFLYQYPEKELVTTAEMFGGIILHGFATNLSFAGALRYVLESLKKPVNNKYFMFGVAALNKFKSRLKEFPYFCQHLCNIPHFRDFPPVLIEYVKYGAQSLEPPVNKLENVPPSVLQDKIAFIINNLSQINISKKAEEFKELLAKEKDQYNPWISQYFVMKRVSLEPNFHELYANFITKLTMKDLSRSVLRETYHNIKILLCTDKQTDNFNDRTLLKNLGQWLGLITLEQNKPVLSIDLDLRNLLIEAYHKGLQQLLYVVPFVAKVIAGCAKSRVFRPPNPWTDALISMLVELHSEEDLKLNLKFEVEVLCKSLELDIEQYVGRPTKLKSKELFSKIEPQLSAPLPRRPPDSSMAASHSSASSADVNLLEPQRNLLTPAQQQGPPAYINASNFSHMPALGHSLYIRPALQLILTTPGLDIFLKALIEKTVQDWLYSSITERNIKVPLVTTETLVKKDFAGQSNPELIKRAAQSMLKSLISGYSLINTKEALTIRMATNLQGCLEAKCTTVSKEMITSTVTTVINDNLDLCVGYVQKTCIERGLDELNKKMQADFEAGVYGGGGDKASKSDGSSVSLRDFAVYEEMGRHIMGVDSQPHHLANSAAPTVVEEGNSLTASHAASLPSASGDAAAIQQQQQQAASLASAFDSFIIIYDNLIAQLTQLIHDAEQIRLNTGPMILVMEILRESKKNPRDKTTAQLLIKNVMHAFRQHILNVEACPFTFLLRARDFYLLVLKVLSDQRAFGMLFTTTHITRYLLEQWVARAQTFPDELFEILTQVGLINMPYMDKEFCGLLENLRNTAAINLMLSFLMHYLSVGMAPSFFAATLEALQRVVFKANQENSNPQLLLAMAQRSLALPVAASSSAAVTPANSLLSSNNTLPDLTPTEVAVLEDNMLTIIKEWVSQFNAPRYTLQGAFGVMLKNMTALGIFKNDFLPRFFKLFMNHVIEGCAQRFTDAAQQQASGIVSTLNEVHVRCYEVIDPYTSLVLQLMKHSGNNTNIDQKFHFLNRILGIVATAAIEEQHRRKADFQPLPFYRILISIFVEIFYAPYNIGVQEVMYTDEYFEIFKMHIVGNYCKLLHQLAPSKVPSFSFAWLEFISHRIFIGKCLDNNAAVNENSWKNFCELLGDLLAFQKPILQNLELNTTSTHLYKGTLKLFLLLLHDFPEFLCEYCYIICDMLPHNAFQIRNLVLSAYPATMRLPDPFSANLNVEVLNEILHPYKGAINTAHYEKIPFKGQLEAYLNYLEPSYLAEIRAYFAPNAAALSEQLDYMNYIVFYVGTKAVKTYTHITLATISNCHSGKLMLNLITNLNTELRYYFLSAIVNHLRFPNVETQYFICLLLHLFKECNQVVKEQIARVVLERLFVFRPHPWGLLFIISELSKNPIYNFWDHEFIKFEPKVTKILDQLGIYNQNELQSGQH